MFPPSVSPSFSIPQPSCNQAVQHQNANLTLAAYWKRFEALQLANQELERLNTVADTQMLIKVSRLLTHHLITV
jgi:hypothetical protein